MNIDDFIVGGLIKVKVISNSSCTKLVEDNGSLKVYLKSIPEKNKANDELIKYFKKKFGVKVMIKSGVRSRLKVLNVIT